MLNLKNDVGVESGDLVSSIDEYYRVITMFSLRQRKFTIKFKEPLRFICVKYTITKNNDPGKPVNIHIR